MSKKVNLTDRHFGRLKGIKPTGNIINHSCEWEFECECGNHCTATVNDVMWCNKSSCGCLKQEENLKHITKARDHQVKAYGTDILRISSTKLQKNNTSGITGITWHNKIEKWQVRIQFQGKPYHLGYYHDLEEAKRIRKIAEQNLFGEFLQWYEDNKKNDIKKY